MRRREKDRARPAATTQFCNNLIFHAFFFDQVINRYLRKSLGMTLIRLYLLRPGTDCINF